MLTTEQVRAVMRDSGYGTDGLTAARFDRVTHNGKFVYRVRFDDDTDEGYGESDYYMWVEKNGRVTGDW
jgi:hypothetical protein